MTNNTNNKIKLSGKILSLLSYPVFLTPIESIILSELINKNGEYVNAQELSKICGSDTCTIKSVVTHIYSINQKAAPIISRQLILCKRGKGYILNSKI